MLVARLVQAVARRQASIAVNGEINMKPYDPQQPLISIHIPKCAGTSFSNILQSWFGEGFCRHYFNEMKNELPVKQKLYSGFFFRKPRQGLCIHGHFNNDRGMGVLDYYPDSDQLITIIRNPWEVHLSNYFYVKRNIQNGKAYRDGKKIGIDSLGGLEDYLKENTRSYICKFLPSNITLDNYKDILEEKFVFTGIAENLQGSVNLLANKLGFSAKEVPTLNESERDENLPDGALEKFMQDNRLEMAIYDHVKNTFGKQLSGFNSQQDIQG